CDEGPYLRDRRRPDRRVGEAVSREVLTSSLLIDARRAQTTRPASVISQRSGNGMRQWNWKPRRRSSRNRPLVAVVFRRRFMTSAGGGPLRANAASGSAWEHLPCRLGYFSRRDVPNVMGDAPLVAERIAQLAIAVAPKHVGKRHDHGCAGR